MSPIRRALLVLAALAPLAVLGARAQGHAGHPMTAAQMPLPTVTFPKDAEFVELPFVEDRNHILVKARIEGAGPIDCFLDTGARGTVVFGDSLVRALGMQPVGEAQIGGVGGGGSPIRGSVFMGVHVALGGLVVSNEMLVSMPDASVPTPPIKGRMAMGRGLLEKVVAEIDWDTRRVRLHDPKTFVYGGRGVRVPLSFDPSGQPYVKARVELEPGRPFDATLVLDTGASHALELQPGSDPHIVSPAGAKREKIGAGATGQVWGAIGKAASVTLGGTTFHDVPVTFPDASLGLANTFVRQGNLGSGLLRRFRVYLDFPNKCMILEPGPHVSEPIVLPRYDQGS